MHKKILIIGLLVVSIIAIGMILYAPKLKAPVTDDTNTPPLASVFDPENASYTVDGTTVILENGSSTKGSVTVFGIPTMGDLDMDSVDDAAFILTQDTDGSGIFFYIVAARNTSSGAVGTHAVFLGDRIAPQGVEIRDGHIIVNYMDRNPGEPMTTVPSVGKSMYLELDGDTLNIINPANQDITYLISSEDSTNYCNGDDMDSDGYRRTLTQTVSTSTMDQLTQAELVQVVARAATTGTCSTALGQLDISVDEGVVTIPPLDGWAGISIALCSCKPEVEVNLLRLPGITSVVWE